MTKDTEMTKEKLEKEAEEYKEKRRFKSINDDCDVVISQNKWLETLKEAYLAGAEPREKCIAELEKENAKLQAKIDDWQSEYIELENFKNNEIAELKEQLEIYKTNADTYYDELTKLQEQLVKTTQIGMTCSNCKWSQYDEDEMCYCCSDKDKWELKLRR